MFNIRAYTNELLKIFLNGLGDEEDEIKSNAAYGIGVLFQNSTDLSQLSLQIPQILNLLQHLFKGDRSNNMQDNACGAVCRMITAYPTGIPLDLVIPVILKALPLCQDDEEYTPVFKALLPLIINGNQILLESLPKLMSLFSHCLSKKTVNKKAKMLITEFLCHLRNVQNEKFLVLVNQMHPNEAQIISDSTFLDYFIG